MKSLRKSIGAAATIFVAAALIFTTSCTKDNDSPAASDPQKAEVKAIADKGLQADIRNAANHTPPIAWYNKTMDKVIVYNPHHIKSKSFSFSDPSDGWNFSSNEGVQWVQNPGGGGVLFITPGSFGSNSGSGVVVAGNTTLDINFTFCFSADEDGMDLGLVDTDGYSGVSGVIGIAADMDALVNLNFDDEGEGEGEDEDVDIESFFQGLAYYLVFDGQAQGNYSVLNYIDNVDSPDFDEGSVEGEGFSIVFGFGQNSVGFYVSKDGSINVDGGSMDFNGNYYGFELNGFFDDDGEDADFEGNFVEVSGYGQMGC